jgi:Glycoside-hydrolase family GH114
MRLVVCALVLTLAASGCGDEDKAPLPSATATATSAVAPAASPSNQASNVTTTRPPVPVPSNGDASDIGSGPVASVDAGPRAADASVPAPSLPPANVNFDYQLGGAYSPPSDVGVVARDRTASPAAGFYNICYVNGFQVQPGEEADWDAELLLTDVNGELVIDQDWSEVILDVSSADKRERIAEVVGGWIAGCADAGFDAVEIDNLDTFSRSDGLLQENDAIATIALYAAAAHAHGLAIAQKNSVELAPRRTEMGTDFAVVEECNSYEECDGYIDTYGAHVLMIEYVPADFTTGCERYGADYAIVLRDLDLVAPGRTGYVREGC